MGKWILTVISNDDYYCSKWPENTENAVLMSIPVRIHLPTPTGVSSPQKAYILKIYPSNAQIQKPVRVPPRDLFVCLLRDELL